MDQGKILREYIKQSKFTQRELSKRLGMRENYFSMVLNKEKLSDDFIQKVSAVLEVSPDNLFTIKEDSYKLKYEQLNEEYNSFQKSYLVEKSQLLNQVQELMAENHTLKNDIHALKDEILELKKK